MFERLAESKAAHQPYVPDLVVTITRSEASRLVEMVLDRRINRRFTDTLSDDDKAAAIPFEVRVKVTIPNKGLIVSAPMRIAIPPGKRGRPLGKKNKG